jgi:predicted  nucleic acid-binding Zn-ribbon protein
MSSLALLVQLQELDLNLEAQTAALQEIGSALGETGELSTALAQVDSLRELLHDQEQRLRELEWDVDEINRHLADEERRLYGGRVHNPKELEGLQKDLEQRRERRTAIEDRELQLMADVEATQSELTRAQGDLTRIRDEWEVEQRRLSAQQSELTDRLDALRASRSQLAASIEGANLSLYEKLRREKRGRAVARVERSACTGCRLALPMNVVQHVRAGRDLVFCPSCGRILYV